MSGCAESLAPVDESEGLGSQANIEKLKIQSKNSENKRVENRLASEADIGSFGVDFGLIWGSTTVPNR